MINNLFKFDKLIDTPDSVDKAIENISDKPTQVLGTYIASWLYLRFGDTIQEAKIKRALHNAKFEEFVNSTSSKVDEIPKDKRQAPDPLTIDKVLDGVIQTDPDSEVREIFSNLIASSMHEDLAAHSHVSFVEIAKQLSSTDAHIFKILVQHSRIPVCKVFLLDDPGFNEMVSLFGDANYPITDADDPFVQFPNLSGTDVSMHYTLLDEITAPHFQAEQSFDNLSRLGLISLDYTITLPNFSYDPFKVVPDIASYFSKDEDCSSHKLVPGVCSVTRFGKTFATVCLD